MANAPKKTKGDWPADTPRDICAVTQWPSNGEMMYDLYRLGYVDLRKKIVDMTYGMGTWWHYLEDRHLGRPILRLVRHDIAIDGVDFRIGLPERSRSVSTVLFDPPYVSTGGRTTSTLDEFNGRYGVLHSEKTPELNQTKLINPGITEGARILAPDGKLIVKTTNYISSNAYKQAERWAIEHAESIGLVLHDRLIMKGHVRAQPAGRAVRHSRNNYSVALVFVHGRETRKRPAKKR